MDNRRHYIKIRGACEHNLKNINVDIPRDSFTVLTGLSGSGKSSLAFDTIYAEGQRRYMESLSSYARQFLGQMEKPNVESIEGLSPAISIDQKSTNRNPRSTVGTVTEIYDYLRLLYARVGVPHCPKCGREIHKQTVDQMVDSIKALEPGTKFQLLAPVVRGRKGMHEKVFESAKKSGYVRVRVDGNNYDLSEEIQLEKNIKHNIEIIVDRLVVKDGSMYASSLPCAFMNLRTCSSAGTMDVVAPISAPILVMVARSGTSSVAAPGPTYSYTLPSPPLMVTLRSISRMTSLALTPGWSFPVRLTLMTLGIFSLIGTPVMAVATSIPPTPIHNIPMEPPCGVWLSPPMLILPGAPNLAT